jgi:hypothetical protein
MTLPSEARPPWRWHAGALAFYAGLSWLIVAHGAALTGPIFGHGDDPLAFIWFLAWYPFALAHHLDPFWTHYAWQPAGLALLWMSSVPLLAVLAAPLTIWLGPVPSYNLLVLAAPVLSAWCMYRLCLRIAGAPAIAVLGGFLFGFSTYEVAQVATLNLSFTFLLPCLGWIVLLRMQGGLKRWPCAALLALAGTGQFLISTEIFAMTIVFGSFTWALGYVLIRELRAALRALAVDAIIAGVAVLVVLSPVLKSMFSNFPYIHLPKLWPYFFAASPTSFFVPGPNTLLHWPAADGLVNGLASDPQEQDSYLGLPLMLILYIYARQNWRDPSARLLSVMLAGLSVLSLGPHLWIGAHYTMIRLPWALLMRLPLLNGALPVRFALFVAFFTAPIVCLWIRAGEAQMRLRFALALLACLLIWPAPRAQTAQPASIFFAGGRLNQVLGPAPQLLILPFAIRGPSSFWQVETGFGFTQTGGYLGFPPRSMQHFKAIWELTAQDPAKIIPADVADFAHGTKADYIVAGPGTPAGEIAVIEDLHWRERKVDDVTIFDVPAGGTGG